MGLATGHSVTMSLQKREKHFGVGGRLHAHVMGVKSISEGHLWDGRLVQPFFPTPNPEVGILSETKRLIKSVQAFRHLTLDKKTPQIDAVKRRRAHPVLQILGHLSIGEGLDLPLNDSTTAPTKNRKHARESVLRPEIVGIQESHIFALGLLKTKVPRLGRTTTVLSQNPSFGDGLTNEFHTSVGAAVVHRYQFHARKKIASKALQRLRKITLGIVDRHDDGNGLHDRVFFLLQQKPGGFHHNDREVGLILDTVAEKLFHCAVSEPPRAALLWRDFVKTRSLADLTFDHQRLLPAVWKNLRHLNEDIPASDKLSNIYRHTRLTNLGRQKSCEQIISALQNSGVPVIVLKGVTLNIDVYQDLGARPAHDFDLLVPFHQADEAFEVARREGWSRVENYQPSLKLEHGETLTKGQSEFDLHWFALREARDVVFDHPLWEAAVPFKVGDVETLMLCPEHQLLHLLVNGTRELEHCYRFLIDLTMFLRKYEHRLDISLVEEQLGNRHLLHRLSYLPLEEIGYGHLFSKSRPTLLDRCWSWCSRCIHDGSGELLFGVFPFLDYALHYAGRKENPLNLLSYFQHRLKITGPVDFATRCWKKMVRTASG